MTNAWHVEPHADGYHWHVTVDHDEAEGTSPTEAQALRSIAYALDFLRGETAMTGTKRRDPRRTEE